MPKPKKALRKAISKGSGKRNIKSKKKVLQAIGPNWKPKIPEKMEHEYKLNGTRIVNKRTKKRKTKT